MSAIMSQSGEEGVNDHVKDGKLSIAKWRKWENSKTKASAKQQRSTEILNQLTKKPQTKEDGEVQQLKSKIQELEQENKKLKETVVGGAAVVGYDNIVIY
ncbi:UNVERIFIED_CONTAM: hypothetical protein FKN15_015097 [Acipenser sinensis]